MLVEKYENGSTKTVNKAYNINELMAYFTANNPMAAAIWTNTQPDQPAMETVFDGVKTDTELRQFTPAEQKKIRLDLKQAQTFLRQQGFTGKYKIDYSNLPKAKLYYMQTKNLVTGKTINVAAANSMDELMSYFWTRLDPDYQRLWEVAKASIKA